jgi:hypothetical protein
MDDAQPRPRLHAASLWGVLGFTFILVQAIARLTPLALEPIRDGTLEPWHWALYGVSIVLNGYSEGYRGFQLQAAPRIVARALHLGDHPHPVRVALAPFFVTGLFHATRRRLIATWVLYLAIVGLVILVRQVPQPWRGMVDAGVVVGLTWGGLSILWIYGRALAGHPPTTSPDLPGQEPRREQHQQ